MKFPRRGKLLEPYAPVARTRSTPIDWSAWLRRIERARRLLQRHDGMRPKLDPPGYYVAATATTFQLDGHALSVETVHGWVAGMSSRRPIRSRLEQRVRNHVAILRRVEVSIRLGEPLRAGSVVRWYTSISAGLAPTDLHDGSLLRLDQIVRRINSPQLRLQPAVQEIATTHVQNLLDPVVPSFNGILSHCSCAITSDAAPSRR